MLIALVLGVTEASLIHHHPFRIWPVAAEALMANDANASAGGRSAIVGHVCALCVVGLQGMEPPTATSRVPASPTPSPLADPPTVIDLSTCTGSNSKRGPPAA